MDQQESTRTRKPTVLITRPVGQSTGFSQLCEARGFRTLLLPCISIVPCKLKSEVLIAQVEAHETLLFISANAVHAAHALYPLPWQHKRVHAIGAATARTLHVYGQTTDIEPKAPYSSESYLEQLESKTPGSMLILKGKGGRELINTQLNERSWRTSTIDLYERILPSVARRDIDQIVLHQKPDVISITSNEILMNLKTLTQHRFDLIKSIPLVVNSERCEKLAKQLGFLGDIRIAMPAGDQGQIACLEQWQEHAFD